MPAGSHVVGECPCRLRNSCSCGIPYTRIVVFLYHVSRYFEFPFLRVPPETPMLTSAFHVNQFLLGYCRLLSTDIADERLAEQPAAGVNHPAWILGHLAVTADSTGRLLGQEQSLPQGWHKMFGPGSQLTTVRSDYPSKEELLSALEQCFARLRESAAAATPAQLATPTTIPRLRQGLPTTADVVAFLLTGHFGVHLGQLSTWRRLIGIPPLF